MVIFFIIVDNIYLPRLWQLLQSSGPQFPFCPLREKHTFHIGVFNNKLVNGIPTIFLFIFLFFFRTDPLFIIIFFFCSLYIRIIYTKSELKKKKKIYVFRVGFQTCFVGGGQYSLRMHMYIKKNSYTGFLNVIPNKKNVYVCIYNIEVCI